MTGFLKELIGRLESVTLNGLKGPERKVEEGDHIVGLMSGPLKALWAIRDEVYRAIKGLEREAILAAVDAKDKQEVAAALEKLKEPLVVATARAQVLDRILWASIRHEFPEMAMKDISLREGWRVVWSEERPEPADILESLLSAIRAGHAHVAEFAVPRRKPQG